MGKEDFELIANNPKLSDLLDDFVMGQYKKAQKAFVKWVKDTYFATDDIWDVDLLHYGFIGVGLAFDNEI